MSPGRAVEPLTPLHALDQRPMRTGRILVASDGSPSTIAAARRAIELLGTQDDIEVVTVARAAHEVAMVPVPGTGLVPPIPAQAARQESVDSRSRADADRAAAALGISPTGRVLHGAPGPAICRYAAETKAAAIVVHPHAAGVLKRILIGSTTRYIVNHAPCTVLVAR